MVGPASGAKELCVRRGYVNFYSVVQIELVRNACLFILSSVVLAMKVLCVATMAWNACTEMRRASANEAGEMVSMGALWVLAGSCRRSAGSGGPKGD